MGWKALDVIFPQNKTFWGKRFSKKYFELDNYHRKTENQLSHLQEQ